jgi:hypothetical protein
VEDVPGRRTDASDGQSLQFLHSAGCCGPDIARRKKFALCGRCSGIERDGLDSRQPRDYDITGQTGLAIVDAILAGERGSMGAREAAQRADQGHRRGHRQIAGGHYRAEYLFPLRQSLAAHCSYQKLIDDCDHEIRRLASQVHRATRLPKPNPTDRLPKVSYGRN